jgi:hypothetical protein
MAYKIAKVHVALGALFDSLGPADEEFPVTFADAAELRLPFTSDPSSIRSTLSFAQARGSTALFDAVALASSKRTPQEMAEGFFSLSPTAATTTAG